MKIFCITPFETLKIYLDRHVITEHHHHELKNGKIVAVVNFHDTNSEEKFLAEPGVVALPHPLSAQVLNHEHEAHLSEFGIKAGDSLYAATKKLAAHHPLLRF